MDLCTELSDRVFDLETIKTAQAKEIAIISSEDEGLGDQEDASKQGRKIDDIDQDAKVTLVNETQGMYDDAQMFDTYVFNGEEVFVAEQTLAKLRSAKPKVVVQEPVQSTTTTTPSTIPKAKSITFRDPAEEEEQAILAREKAEKVKEANISWDNVQAMIEADRLLAERLQAREQEELTNEEKARLFVELLEKRKKHFVALRAQEKRNKPPTKAQKKSTMSTYLKNIVGYKQSQLNNKSFTEIQKLFDKAMTRVNMFVDKDTEARIREGKKQKIHDDQEEAGMKKLIKVVPDEKEVAIDAIPLATKPPSIVDWKIAKEEKISLIQIIRANGSSKRYSLMIQMLRDFDKEDLETLWKLVKAKHRNTRPKEGYEIYTLRVSAAGTKVTTIGVKVTTAGRVYTDREEIKDLSEKR
ncbi:hypothetical protein Tco_0634777 [Tanacetum coccineum]